MDKRSIGNVGEDAVCDFLLRHGYKILNRNFTIRGGEIDIIASNSEVLAFVEVKTRKKNSLIKGEEAITKQKISHIIKTAERYLCEIENLNLDVRFDVALVEIEKEKICSLKYVPNAFDASYTI